MKRPDTFRIPYQLVADLHVPDNFDKSSSTDDSPTDGQIEMTLSSNILDLYRKLNNHLKDSHVDITIQFPCSEPLFLAADLLNEANQDPSHTARYLGWIKLVGFSGFQYDPSSVTVKDLRECWPVQEEGPHKPIQVVAIPKQFIKPSQPLTDVNVKLLRDRLHLMGSLHDLFYTKADGRIISMPTLDSRCKEWRKHWIRDCWHLFQEVVIKHFKMDPQGLPITERNAAHPPMKPVDDTLVGAFGDADQRLLRSIISMPEWIYSLRACSVPFAEDLNIHLPEGEFLDGFFVNGQRGTGKSQMLIYLIYCLMQRLEKVAIIYILPDMPVITILVDHSNHTNPIRVRSHISSLGETYFTKGFPVIRIVDSEDPFKNKRMRRVFVVYAASPTQFEQHMKNIHKHMKTCETESPFWSTLEYYTMMFCLEMTDDENWIRRVHASTIARLPPVVIKLLGAHGYLVEEADDSTVRRCQAQSSAEGSFSESTSLSDFNVFVCLNVIEVFGLCPRALSADLNTFFGEISQKFGSHEITLDEKELINVFDPLLASTYRNRPVSLFASRFLAFATRLHPNRYRTLEYDVNQELFRSHAKFTVHTATPERFQTFDCTFPVIYRCPLLSSQLDELQSFESDVLYYEILFDPQSDATGDPWKGIDSFIFFHVAGRIKLFAFQNTVNDWKKEMNYQLIERLKTLLELQYAKPLPKPDYEDRTESEKEKESVLMSNADLDVFFLWIVRPEHVEPFIKKTVIFPKSPRSDHDWTSRRKKETTISMTSLSIDQKTLLLDVLQVLPKDIGQELGLFQQVLTVSPTSFTLPDPKTVKRRVDLLQEELEWKVAIAQENEDILSESKVRFLYGIKILKYEEKASALHHFKEAADLLRPTVKPILEDISNSRMAGLTEHQGTTVHSSPSSPTTEPLVKSWSVTKLPSTPQRALPHLPPNLIAHAFYYCLCQFEQSRLENSETKGELLQTSLQICTDVDFISLIPAIRFQLGIHFASTGNYSQSMRCLLIGLKILLSESSREIPFYGDISWSTIGQVLCSVVECILAMGDDTFVERLVSFTDSIVSTNLASTELVARRKEIATKMTAFVEERKKQQDDDASEEDWDEEFALEEQQNTIGDSLTAKQIGVSLSKEIDFKDGVVPQNCRILSRIRDKGPDQPNLYLLSQHVVSPEQIHELLSALPNRHRPQMQLLTNLISEANVSLLVNGLSTSTERPNPSLQSILNWSTLCSLFSYHLKPLSSHFQWSFFSTYFGHLWSIRSLISIDDTTTFSSETLLKLRIYAISLNILRNAANYVQMNTLSDFQKMVRVLTDISPFFVDWVYLVESQAYGHLSPQFPLERHIIPQVVRSLLSISDHAHSIFKAVSDCIMETAFHPSIRPNLSALPTSIPHPFLNRTVIPSFLFPIIIGWLPQDWEGLTESHLFSSPSPLNSTSVFDSSEASLSPTPDLTQPISSFPSLETSPNFPIDFISTLSLALSTFPPSLQTLNFHDLASKAVIGIHLLLSNMDPLTTQQLHTIDSGELTYLEPETTHLKIGPVLKGGNELFEVGVDEKDRLKWQYNTFSPDLVASTYHTAAQRSNKSNQLPTPITTNQDKVDMKSAESVLGMIEKIEKGQQDETWLDETNPNHNFQKNGTRLDYVRLEERKRGDELFEDFGRMATHFNTMQNNEDKSVFSRTLDREWNVIDDSTEPQNGLTSPQQPAHQLPAGFVLKDGMIELAESERDDDEDERDEKPSQPSSDSEPCEQDSMNDDNSNISEENTSIHPLLKESIRLRCLVSFFNTSPTLSVRSKLAFSIGLTLLHSKSNFEAAESSFLEAIELAEAASVEEVSYFTPVIFSQYGFTLLRFFADTALHQTHIDYSIEALKSAVAFASMLNEVKIASHLCHRIAAIAQSNHDFETATFYASRYLLHTHLHRRVHQFDWLLMLNEMISVNRLSGNYLIHFECLKAALEECVRQPTLPNEQTLCFYTLFVESFIERGMIGRGLELVSLVNLDKHPNHLRIHFLLTIAKAVKRRRGWNSFLTLIKLLEIQFSQIPRKELIRSRVRKTWQHSMDRSATLDDREPPVDLATLLTNHQRHQDKTRFGSMSTIQTTVFETVLLVVSFYQHQNDLFKALDWCDHIISLAGPEHTGLLAKAFYKRGKILAALSLPHNPDMAELSNEPLLWDCERDLIPMKPCWIVMKGEMGEASRANDQVVFFSDDNVLSVLKTYKGISVSFAPHIHAPSFSNNDYSFVLSPNVKSVPPTLHYLTQPPQGYTDTAAFLVAAILSFERAQEYQICIGDTAGCGKSSAKIATAFLQRVFPSAALFMLDQPPLLKLPSVSSVPPLPVADMDHLLWEDISTQPNQPTASPSQRSETYSLTISADSIRSSLGSMSKTLHLSSTTPPTTRPPIRSKLLEYKEGKELNMIEYFGTDGLDSALSTSDILGSIEGYISLAEIRFLGGRIKDASAFWNEAKTTFMTLFVDGATFLFPPLASPSVFDRLVSMFGRIVRFLFCFDDVFVKRNLDLIDIYLQMEIQKKNSFQAVTNAEVYKQQLLTQHRPTAAQMTKYGSPQHAETEGKEGSAKKSKKKSSRDKMEVTRGFNVLLTPALIDRLIQPLRQTVTHLPELDRVNHPDDTPSKIPPAPRTKELLAEVVTRSVAQRAKEKKMEGENKIGLDRLFTHLSENDLRPDVITALLPFDVDHLFATLFQPLYPSKHAKPSTITEPHLDKRVESLGSHLERPLFHQPSFLDKTSRLVSGHHSPLNHSVNSHFLVELRRFAASILSFISLQTQPVPFFSFQMRLQHRFLPDPFLNIPSSYDNTHHVPLSFNFPSFIPTFKNGIKNDLIAKRLLKHANNVTIPVTVAEWVKEMVKYFETSNPSTQQLGRLVHNMLGFIVISFRLFDSSQSEDTSVVTSVKPSPLTYFTDSTPITTANDTPASLRTVPGQPTENLSESETLSVISSLALPPMDTPQLTSARHVIDSDTDLQNTTQNSPTREAYFRRGSLMPSQQGSSGYNSPKQSLAHANMSRRTSTMTLTPSSSNVEKEASLGIPLLSTVLTEISQQESLFPNTVTAIVLSFKQLRQDCARGMCPLPHLQQTSNKLNRLLKSTMSDRKLRIDALARFGRQTHTDLNMLSLAVDPYLSQQDFHDQTKSMLTAPETDTIRMRQAPLLPPRIPHSTLYESLSHSVANHTRMLIILHIESLVFFFHPSTGERRVFSLGGSTEPLFKVSGWKESKSLMGTTKRTLARRSDVRESLSEEGFDDLASLGSQTRMNLSTILDDSEDLSDSILPSPLPKKKEEEEAIPEYLRKYMDPAGDEDEVDEVFEADDPPKTIHHAPKPSHNIHLSFDSSPHLSNTPSEPTAVRPRMPRKESMETEDELYLDGSSRLSIATPRELARTKQANLKKQQEDDSDSDDWGGSDSPLVLPPKLSFMQAASDISHNRKDTIHSDTDSDSWSLSDSPRIRPKQNPKRHSPMNIPIDSVIEESTGSEEWGSEVAGSPESSAPMKLGGFGDLGEVKENEEEDEETDWGDSDVPTPLEKRIEESIAKEQDEPAKAQTTSPQPSESVMTKTTPDTTDPFDRSEASESDDWLDDGTPLTLAIPQKAKQMPAADISVSSQQTDSDDSDWGDLSEPLVLPKKQPEPNIEFLQTDTVQSSSEDDWGDDEQPQPLIISEDGTATREEPARESNDKPSPRNEDDLDERLMSLMLRFGEKQTSSDSDSVSEVEELETLTPMKKTTPDFDPFATDTSDETGFSDHTRKPATSSQVIVHFRRYSPTSESGVFGEERPVEMAGRRERMFGGPGARRRTYGIIPTLVKRISLNQRKESSKSVQIKSHISGPLQELIARANMRTNQRLASQSPSLTEILNTKYEYQIMETRQAWQTDDAHVHLEKHLHARIKERDSLLIQPSSKVRLLPSYGAASAAFPMIGKVVSPTLAGCGHSDAVMTPIKLQSNHLLTSKWGQPYKCSDQMMNNLLKDQTKQERDFTTLRICPHTPSSCEGVFVDFVNRICFGDDWPATVEVRETRKKNAEGYLDDFREIIPNPSSILPSNTTPHQYPFLFPSISIDWIDTDAQGWKSASSTVMTNLSDFARTTLDESLDIPLTIPRISQHAKSAGLGRYGQQEMNQLVDFMVPKLDGHPKDVSATPLILITSHSLSVLPWEQLLETHAVRAFTICEGLEKYGQIGLTNVALPPNTTIDDETSTFSWLNEQHVEENTSDSTKHEQRTALIPQTVLAAPGVFKTRLSDFIQEQTETGIHPSSVFSHIMLKSSSPFSNTPHQQSTTSLAPLLSPINLILPSVSNFGRLESVVPNLSVTLDAVARQMIRFGLFSFPLPVSSLVTRTMEGTLHKNMMVFVKDSKRLQQKWKDIGVAYAQAIVEADSTRKSSKKAVFDRILDFSVQIGKFFLQTRKYESEGRVKSQKEGLTSSKLGLSSLSKSSVTETVKEKSSSPSTKGIPKSGIICNTLITKILDGATQQSPDDTTSFLTAGSRFDATTAELPTVQPIRKLVPPLTKDVTGILKVMVLPHSLPVGDFVWMVDQFLGRNINLGAGEILGAGGNGRELISEDLLPPEATADVMQQVKKRGGNKRDRKGEGGDVHLFQLVHDFGRIEQALPQRPAKSLTLPTHPLFILPMTDLLDISPQLHSLITIRGNVSFLFVPTREVLFVERLFSKLYDALRKPVDSEDSIHPQRNLLPEGRLEAVGKKGKKKGDRRMSHYVMTEEEAGVMWGETDYVFEGGNLGENKTRHASIETEVSGGEEKKKGKGREKSGGKESKLEMKGHVGPYHFSFCEIEYRFSTNFRLHPTITLELDPRQPIPNQLFVSQIPVTLSTHQLAKDAINAFHAWSSRKLGIIRLKTGQYPSGHDELNPLSRQNVQRDKSVPQNTPPPDPHAFLPQNTGAPISTAPIPTLPISTAPISPPKSHLPSNTFRSSESNPTALYDPTAPVAAPPHPSQQKQPTFRPPQFLSPPSHPRPTQPNQPTILPPHIVNAPPPLLIPATIQQHQLRGFHQHTPRDENKKLLYPRSFVECDENDTFFPQFPATNLTQITNLRRAGLHFLSMSDFVEKGHHFDAETRTKALNFVEMLSQVSKRKRNDNWSSISHHDILKHVGPQTLDITTLFLERVLALLSSRDMEFISSVLQFLSNTLVLSTMSELETFWDSRFFSRLPFKTSAFEQFPLSTLHSLVDLMSDLRKHLPRLRRG
ncbi:hypothetical protein BLNAU_1187 [Blattamonas nauphoetae]|uniref:Uncharacterized protein n=1 Tax=Blattamonas nauphoetae TaxID=2049346 RepID=A0ABQ9YIN0_9EUKA|nr:hypothetical protein BLNAU_1187 [Blattamonas nauphoetae]